MYNFSEPALAKALIRAEERGVRVRLVMESDNFINPIPQKIRASGIPIVVDKQDSLMHNKFMVVDEYDRTDRVSKLHREWLEFRQQLPPARLKTRSWPVCTSQEFNSMFENGDFGATDLQPTTQNQFVIDGKPMGVYFSPEDGISEKLLALVDQADTSIHFLAYTFTLDDLGEELVQKYQSGVDVRGVFEGEILPGSTGTEYDRLRRAGMDIRLDGNPALMHEKLMIIDGEIVVIGSYNFTRAADERNDENILIIHDSSLAHLFENEFNRVFEASQP